MPSFYETQRLPPRTLLYAVLAASVAAWIACPLRYLHWLKFVPSIFIALEYLVIVMISAFSGAVASYGPGLRLYDQELRRGSVGAVAVAIWMAPLMLLFLERSVLSGIVAAGIVLAGCAATAIPVGESLEMAESLPAEAERACPPQFGITQTRGFARQLARTIFTSTLLQMAALGDFIGERGLALVLFVIGAAFLAAQLRSAKDESVVATRTIRPRSYLLASSALATGVIIIGLLPLLVSLGRPNNLLDAFLRRLLFHGGTPQISRSHSVHREQTRLRNDGYIGVILTPKQLKTTPASPLPQISLSAQAPGLLRPLAIPFTGSYWFFQYPFARPPMDSINAEGDPARVRVRSSNHQPLLMEAVQNLYEHVETGRVGEVQLAMLDVDPLPGTVSVELVLADTSVWGHPSQSLGIQRIGAPMLIESTSSHSENLNFVVPKHSRCREFNQMRLIFTLDPSRSRQGAAVAVQSFLLMPRTM